MPKKSAGILLFRIRNGTKEVLLAHPGGPFYARKDEGIWTIPKGEFDAGELAIDAAKREFAEELGTIPRGDFIELQPIQQKGGKWVYVWALEGDLDCSNISCNMFTMEWPPRSGKMQAFPEVDRAAWFTLDEARIKILESQRPLLDQLEAQVKL